MKILHRCRPAWLFEHWLFSAFERVCWQL